MKSRFIKYGNTFLFLNLFSKELFFIIPNMWYVPDEDLKFEIRGTKREKLWSRMWTTEEFWKGSR